MESKYIFAILVAIVAVAVIIAIATSKKSRKPPSPPPSGSTLWSGNCPENLQSGCDTNNNCVVSCQNNVVKSSQNLCSKTSQNCDNAGNCNVDCISPPRQIVGCDSGMVGIWQGECPNVISLSSDNNQITFMCGDDTIQPKTLCEGTSVNCQNDMCAVCCQPLKPPVPPSCPSGSEEVWTGDCDFIQSDCNNNSCTVSCGGNQVYSGNCENIQTSCNNSACVACCTAGGNVPMPTCVGTEVWRTQDPSSCANINSSCQNGTCTIMCNGNVVYTDNSGYNTISTACNTAGCVACVD